MSIQKITPGLTGQQVADLIYANETEIVANAAQKVDIPYTVTTGTDGKKTSTFDNVTAANLLSVAGNIEISEVAGLDEAVCDANGYLLYYYKDGVRYDASGAASAVIANNYGTFAQKAKDGQALRVSLYGSSISHSENGQGGLTSPTLAESAQAILQKGGLNATVVNNGIGGADTNQTLSQVLADTNIYDVVFVEDGGNDRSNGLTFAKVKSNLVAIVKTLISRGSWVILWPCVETNQAGINEGREYYRNVWVEVGRELNCPIFNASLQNQYRGMRWGDGVVHYNDAGSYAEIAVAIASFMLYRGQLANHVVVGDIVQPLYLAMSNPLNGNFASGYSPNGFTQMIPVKVANPAQPYQQPYAFMVFYAAQRCKMYIKTVDGDSAAKTLTVSYGNSVAQPDITINQPAVNTGQGGAATPLKYPLYTLEKGWKIIFFQTTANANKPDGSASGGVFWVEIGFEAI